MKKSWPRALRAQIRDTQVLFRESRQALAFFAILVLGSALIFYLFYTEPLTGARITFPQALYGAFSLLFFQGSLDFPSQWYLEILFFLIPIFGLVIVADGVIHFGVALTNKKERGQKWQIAMASTYSNHIIICGIGKVGYRVALELMKYGREIVAIEADAEGRFVEKVKALGIPVIIADAQRSENLVKAGVEKADAIIPCTNDELANLDIALDARELNPDIKVVLRLFDPDLARRVEKGFGIHTAFSVSALAAPVIAAASMRVPVMSSFYLGDRLLHISELDIPHGSRLEGWTVGKLEEEFNLSVVSAGRDGDPQMHPASGTPLEAGSRILVIASMESLDRLFQTVR